MSFREAFILSLRAVGVPDGLVLDALLAAEASERARRAAARAAKMNEADSRRAAESGSQSPGQGIVASPGAPVKGLARRGVMRALALTPAARAVSAFLIDAYNLDSGRCDWPVAEIARSCGLVGRSVRRAVAELEGAGLVRRVVHGGKRHTNAYRLEFAAMASLAPDLAARKMNDPDSGAAATRTHPDKNVRQNKIEIHTSSSAERPASRAARQPDRRQGSFLLPIPGKAAVAENAAQSRLWSDLHRHFKPHGPKALEAATLRLMDGGLAEKATAAEQSKRGDGLRVVLDVLREAG